MAEEVVQTQSFVFHVFSNFLYIMHRLSNVDQPTHVQFIDECHFKASRNLFWNKHIFYTWI